MINITVINDKGEVTFNKGFTNYVRAQSVFFGLTNQKHCPNIEDILSCKKYSFDNVTAEYVR